MIKAAPHAATTHKGLAPTRTRRKVATPQDQALWDYRTDATGLVAAA
jgi:hypothetical protein